MISERDIAEKFSIVWKQSFPMLNSNFIKVYNITNIKNINSVSIQAIENVRYDLVSEVALNITQIVFEHKIQPEEFLKNKIDLIQLIEATAKGIWKNENYSIEDLELSEFECEEINKICNNVIEFINSFRSEKVIFKPKFKGYGFISDLTGDLLIDDTLFEIKSVNRNFISNDLKQLFLYLALNHMSKVKKIEFAGLYNPRKGIYSKFKVNEFVSALAGGVSQNEAFDNLLNSLIREVQIDSQF